MNIKDLVREDIRELVPYEPHLFSNVIKMDANENPYPFPPQLMRELYSRLDGDSFSRYPDPTTSALKEKIAEFTGTEKANIVLGNGSDELILLILQTFGGPGKRVIVPVPTFSMYKIHGQVTGTNPVEVPRNSAFGLDTGAMLKAMKHPDTRITYIATPNNPTGNCVPLEQIRELVSGVPSLVVVDEAYIDFGGETCIPLLKEFKNLIILRTFSKIGLAGLRVGYLFAHHEVVTELLKVKQPYNVNTISQVGALTTLDCWPVIQKQIEEIAAERERLIAELDKIPYVTVFPSKANFILFKSDIPAEEVHERLLERRILIRKNLGVTHELQKCLRVSVGTPQENDLFLESMKSIG